LFIASFALKNVALDVFPGGDAGVALVDNNGNVKAIVGNSSLSARNPGSTLTFGETFNFAPLSVASGQYKLKIAVKPANSEEWRIVTASVGDAPLAIDFTVTAEESATLGGGYGLVLEEFSPSKTSVSQNEMFSVAIKTRERNLDTFTGGQAGVALVDNNGNIVRAIQIINFASLSFKSARTSTMNCILNNTVPPGQYKLRIIFKPTDDEWRIATLSMPNVPNSIDFTVTPAQIGNTDDGYGLALTNFIASKTTASQNERFTVKSGVRNVALDTFPGGQVGVALADNNGNIKAIVGSSSLSAKNPGSTSNFNEISNFVPASATPGQYKLRMVVKLANSEEWRIVAASMDDVPSAIDFTVAPAQIGDTDDSYGLALTAFTTSKTAISQNEAFTVSSGFRNVALDTFPGGQAGVVLIDSNNNVKAVTGIRNLGELGPGRSYSTREASCVVPNTVASGKYRLRMAVIRGSEDEWQIVTLSLEGVPNFIDFENNVNADNSKRKSVNSGATP
jgi:hypothetical protein